MPAPAREQAYMLGTGTNRANISGIKLDMSDMEIEGLGEGLFSKDADN